MRETKYYIVSGDELHDVAGLLCGEALQKVTDALRLAFKNDQAWKWYATLKAIRIDAAQCDSGPLRHMGDYLAHAGLDNILVLDWTEGYDRRYYLVREAQLLALDSAFARLGSQNHFWETQSALRALRAEPVLPKNVARVREYSLAELDDCEAVEPDLRNLLVSQMWNRDYEKIAILSVGGEQLPTRFVAGGRYEKESELG